MIKIFYYRNTIIKSKYIKIYMGIKNLKVLLKKYCQTAIHVRNIDNYQQNILGIDFSIYLYKYLYNNNDHIEGFTRLILRLLKNKITPVFVFDGKPPKEKYTVLENRREKKELIYMKKDIIENSITFNKTSFETFKIDVMNYLKTINNTHFILNNDEIRILFEKDKENIEKDCEKLNKKIITITPYHIESSKKLFDLFGIKYIHEQCEAESLLAVLCKKNFIQGCISEDTDILPNGGHLFLTDFNSENNFIKEYCLEGILKNLGFNIDKFIDLCILCGCDYTPKIIGLGPIAAYKIIHKYNDIETFLLQNNISKQYIIPQNFHYIKARNLFKHSISDVFINNINKNFTLNNPNIDFLIQFLEKTSLHKKYIHEIKNNVMNYYLDINLKI